MSLPTKKLLDGFCSVCVKRLKSYAKRNKVPVLAAISQCKDRRRFIHRGCRFEFNQHWEMVREGQWRYNR